MRWQLPFVEQSRLDLWRARWRHWNAGQSRPGEPHMSPTREQRLEHYDSQVYGHVEGWVGDRMSQIVSVFGTILDRNGVRGHVAEFGVHHGRFLFLLNALRNENEECFAIDVFSDQHLNVDNSGGDGRGSLATFLSHIETLMAPQRRFFRIVQRDTMSFST